MHLRGQSDSLVLFERREPGKTVSVSLNNPPRGRIRWVLAGWMFAISAIACLDRVNISIAGSFIQKAFGPRNILAIATVWWAVFTALVAVVPAGIPGVLAVLLTARFLLGVGEAMVFPASNRLVAGWIPSPERGLANGLIFAGVGAGALHLSTSSFWSVTAGIAGRSAGSVSGMMNTGNQIGGTVTASLNPVLANVFGWPSSFLVAAALCFVGSLAWLLVDPQRVLSRKALKDLIATTQ